MLHTSATVLLYVHVGFSSHFTITLTSSDTHYVSIDWIIKHTAHNLCINCTVILPVKLETFPCLGVDALQTSLKHIFNLNLVPWK